MQSICVFCGSSPGVNGSYSRAASEFGRLIAQNNITLVFGGGKVGLMGQLANAVLQHGGTAVGIIPEALVQPEVAHSALTELHVVRTMHERKALMYQRSDAFVALPGGVGTLDEIFEVFTWTQLGLLQKPLGLLNVDGFFDPLIVFLHHAVRQGFIAREQLGRLLIQTDGQKLLRQLQAATVVPIRQVD